MALLRNDGKVLIQADCALKKEILIDLRRDVAEKLCDAKKSLAFYVLIGKSQLAG